MTKTCARCGYATADTTIATCPDCQASLSLTFLASPKPGAPAKAVDLLPGPPQSPAPPARYPTDPPGFDLGAHVVKVVAGLLVTAAAIGAKVYLKVWEHDEEERDARTQQVATSGLAPAPAPPPRRPAPVVVAADADEEVVVPVDEPVVHPSQRLIAPPGGRR